MTAIDFAGGARESCFLVERTEGDAMRLRWVAGWVVLLVVCVWAGGVSRGVEGRVGNWESCQCFTLHCFAVLAGGTASVAAGWQRMHILQRQRGRPGNRCIVSPKPNQAAGRFRPQPAAPDGPSGDTAPPVCRAPIAWQGQEVETQEQLSQGCQAGIELEFDCQQLLVRCIRVVVVGRGEGPGGRAAAAGRQSARRDASLI